MKLAGQGWFWALDFVLLGAPSVMPDNYPDIIGIILFTAGAVMLIGLVVNAAFSRLTTRKAKNDEIEELASESENNGDHEDETSSFVCIEDAVNHIANTIKFPMDLSDIHMDTETRKLTNEEKARIKAGNMMFDQAAKGHLTILGRENAKLAKNRDNFLDAKPVPPEVCSKIQLRLFSQGGGDKGTNVQTQPRGAWDFDNSFNGRPEEDPPEYTDLQVEMDIVKKLWVAKNDNA